MTGKNVAVVLAEGNITVDIDEVRLELSGIPAIVFDEKCQYF